ncbi:hypothetical protein EYF80_049558 [Liparis tanakae]|uniref:Uncharacterized protein n=1 Tax=Liparis tanakae TaxID=230148 RepID=A0A4Z2FH79_9TELE|nr:hypothetical protein EYF80_049558 [Liparis tanakae]
MEDRLRLCGVRHRKWDRFPLISAYSLTSRETDAHAASATSDGSRCGSGTGLTLMSDESSGGGLEDPVSLLYSTLSYLSAGTGTYRSSHS